jgi:mono/diheme cytochrome c family protein
MKYIRLFLFILIPLLMMACNRGKNNPGYDYMGSHDMYYTKFYKAYSPNPILADSMTNQPGVDGAIARGKMPFAYPGATLAERAVNQNKASMELMNPVEVSDEVLARGKEHYDIFCSSCHGITGKGDGHLYTSKLFPAKPTSLVEAYVKGKPDGEIYYVITHGSISGLMGPHGSQIQPDDRWSIIHYVRSLAN